MGLRDKYSYAIQTAKSFQMQGSGATGTDAGRVPDITAHTYVVRAGDTLSKIAREMMGDGGAFMDIFNANRDQLNDPNAIRPGQVLKIPVPVRR
jgi:nucleoid-associated protein YgaU